MKTVSLFITSNLNVNIKYCKSRSGTIQRIRLNKFKKYNFYVVSIMNTSELTSSKYDDDSDEKKLTSSSDSDECLHENASKKRRKRANYCLERKKKYRK